jgi:hypothetical protein
MIEVLGCRQSAFTSVDRNEHGYESPGAHHSPLYELLKPDDSLQHLLYDRRWIIVTEAEWQEPG